MMGTCTDYSFFFADEFETAGRRVAKFADVLASVWEMKHHYEERVIAVSINIYYQKRLLTFIQKANGSS